VTILTVLLQFHHRKIGTKNLIKLWEWTACLVRSNYYCMEWRTKGLTRHLIVIVLTLNPLTWKIWWAPKNANKWQMGFNSAFKGLKMCQWEVKCQLNSYLVGDRTSKQKRRSPSRTGFTVHSRRSSSITVTVSSPRQRHYYLNTKCALYGQMRTSNDAAIYLRASGEAPALNSYTHKTFQLTQCTQQNFSPTWSGMYFWMLYLLYCVICFIQILGTTKLTYHSSLNT